MILRVRTSRAARFTLGQDREDFRSALPRARSARASCPSITAAINSFRAPRALRSFGGVSSRSTGGQTRCQTERGVLHRWVRLDLPLQNAAPSESRLGVGPEPVDVLGCSTWKGAHPFLRSLLPSLAVDCRDAATRNFSSSLGPSRASMIAKVTSTRGAHRSSACSSAALGARLQRRPSLRGTQCARRGDWLGSSAACLPGLTCWTPHEQCARTNGGGSQDVAVVLVRLLFSHTYHRPSRLFAPGDETYSKLRQPGCCSRARFPPDGLGSAIGRSSSTLRVCLAGRTHGAGQLRRRRGLHVAK